MAKTKERDKEKASGPQPKNDADVMMLFAGSSLRRPKPICGTMIEFLNQPLKLDHDPPAVML